MSEHVNGGALNDEQRDAVRAPEKPAGLVQGKQTFGWGELVIVKRAPPQLLPLEGGEGMLAAPEGGEDHVAVLWVGSNQYRIPRSSTWAFERVREPPHERQDRFRSLIGKRVRVTQAPSDEVPSWLSRIAEVLAPRREGVVVELRRVGGAAVGGVFYDRMHQWDFEEITLAAQFEVDDTELTAAELAAGVDTRAALRPRRAREVYDHVEFVTDLDAAVKEIRDLLVEKNQAYGNSALDPVRIFSKADPMEQLFVRIDDKLSRLKRGHAAGEDVVKDLQGYLLLVRVAQMRAERNRNP